MPSSRRRLLLVLALAAGAVARPAAAQDAAMLRALDLEQAGKAREAAVAFREAMRAPNFFPALLGLERAYAELGQSDSLLPILDSLIAARPRDGSVRSVQLRTLHGLGRDGMLRQAFERWAADAPGDPAPYRDYARILLQDGRAELADSVLRRASATFGAGSELAPEMAQMRAQMGLWGAAAREWRTALETSPYLTQMATFSLAGAPSSARDSIREVLAGTPLRLAGRRLLASLELTWGAPREAWAALAPLPPNDSSAQAWREFGEQAEGEQQWLTARDAFAAIVHWRPDAALTARAAENALRADDAASAERLATLAMSGADSAAAARRALPVRVRALAMLGRPEEAAALGDRYGRWLDDATRSALARAAAWGWVRRGETAKAREALRAAGAGDGDETAQGWLALYDGDLEGARTALRHGAESTPELVSAMALLSRTRAPRSAAVGTAFLALARADSARAGDAFASAARELPDAAPLLLVMGARIQAARGAVPQAIALWQNVVSAYVDAPEAPEADLEWGRTLHRGGRDAEAAQRFEHLILTYPGSALVPQARRELELLRGGLPRP